VNKEILFGVVYNPILDELYTGQKGEGSYRNGTPLHVSQCQTLKVLLLIIHSRLY
jgi:myo-inositol-1(or 4)-monophosphatase